MGQGRGGFYSYETIENLLGADIHNADSIVPSLQGLKAGDTVWLTPNPYRGQHGQFTIVTYLETAHFLVLKQTMPNGATGSWAFVLNPRDNRSTRLLVRRRSTRPSIFDRVTAPGYVFMDRAMLRGIRKRVETAAERQ
jgi:hypothetical protein